MNDFELNAQARIDTGKGAVRRLRRSGQVPGVMYGGDKDVSPLQIEGNYLRKRLENEAFFSHIISVNLAGETSQVVIKALQRSPRTQEVTHIDLLRVSASTELTMHVPLHFLNEDTSVGKKAGGIVSHLMVDVEIACLPKDLPEFIELDLAELDIGGSLHLSDLRIPEGVRLTTDVSDGGADHPVVAIQRAAELDVETVEEGVEEVEVEGEAQDQAQPNEE